MAWEDKTVGPTTNQLSGYSEKELKAELQRREEELLAKQEEAWHRHANLVMEHVDSLLALVPEHSRTSCSDTNNCNPDRGCARCVLLETKSMQLLPRMYTLQISFDRNETR